MKSKQQKVEKWVLEMRPAHLLVKATMDLLKKNKLKADSSLKIDLSKTRPGEDIKIEEMLEDFEKNIKGFLDKEHIKRFSFDDVKALRDTLLFKEEERRFDEKKDMAGFEFDPDKVLKVKPFPMLRMGNGIFGYGMLLPKYEQKKIEGVPAYTQQVKVPAMITSDHRLLEITKRFEEDNKVKFNNLPGEMELRWSLPSLKKFLLKKSPKIEGFKLLNEIIELYKKYCYFRKDTWYTIHALWDLSTYFFMLFKAFPIFEIRGGSGTGKSKIMQISNGLTFNACDEIMINPSASTLFRETDSKRITKYIDEAEKLFEEVRGKLEFDERVTFINASYSYKGAVARQDKINGRFYTVYYRAYSPTMIASIKGLYAQTLTRCITHITSKHLKKDGRGKLEPDTDGNAFQNIRNSSYLFALQSWKKIEDAYYEMHVETELSGRDFQIWRPLLTLAKVLSDDLFEEIKAFAEEISSSQDEVVSEGSFDYRVLQAAARIMDEKGSGVLMVADVLEKFVELHGPDYKPNNKTLARKIDGFGFKDYRKRTKTGVGYELTMELFREIITTLNPTLLTALYSLNSYSKGEEQATIKEEVPEEVVCDSSREEVVQDIKENGKDGLQIEEKHGQEIIKSMLKNGEIFKDTTGGYVVNE